MEDRVLSREDPVFVREDLVDTSYPGLMEGTKKLIGAAYATVDSLGVHDPDHAFAAEMLILSGLSRLLVADKGGSSRICYDALHIDGRRLPIQEVKVLIDTLKEKKAAPKTSPVRSLKTATPNRETFENNDPVSVNDAVEIHLYQEPEQEQQDTLPTAETTGMSEYDEAVMEWERDQRRFADKPKMADTGAKVGKRPRGRPAVPSRAMGTLHGGE